MIDIIGSFSGSFYLSSHLSNFKVNNEFLISVYASCFMFMCWHVAAVLFAITIKYGD